jgi:tripartite-type tricarboxylate transporter receptor subunit TctC
MIMRRRAVLIIATGIGLNLGAFTSAFAQPSSARPIRFVVPAAAGGAIEPYARLISEHMGKTLGRVTIIENRPGANGNIAALSVVDAPADGNHVLIGTQSMVEINPSAYDNPRWSLEDFNSLIRGVVAPLVLVTHPSVPARTFDELVAWMKRTPGKLSYSSYTAGTPSHFLGFQVGERFGLDLAHVAYKGSGPQVIDLVAGHSLLGFSQMQSVLPHVAAGKLNAIATTSKGRSRFLPEVPTFAELGHAEFTMNIWFGLMIRAATPPAVVTRLLDAARAAHSDSGVRARLEAQGFDMSGQFGDELVLDIKLQSARWARLIKASGFNAERSR